MFDISNALMGNEAINYQLASPLYRDLTDMFQRAISDIEEFKRQIDDDPSKNELAKKRAKFNKAKDHFIKAYSKEFTDIVKKHTGITVEKLYCTGGENYIDRPSCDYAVLLKFEGMSDNEAMVAIKNAAGDAADYPSYEFAKQFADEIRSIQDDFDKTSGKLKKETYGKNRKLKVSKMFFDINMSFLMDEYIAPERVAPLTAGEISAIMIHEIGHCMSTVEHMGDLYRHTGRLQNFQVTLNKMKAPKTSEEAGKTLEVIEKDIIPQFEKQLKEIDDKSVMTKQLQRVVDTYKSAIGCMSAMRIEDPNLFEKLFLTVVVIWKTVVYFWLFFLGTWYTFLTLFNVAYEVMKSNQAGAGTYGDGKKRSDRGSNRTDIFQVERWADQFASRHGAGADVATGLEKIHNLFDIYYGFGTSLAPNVKGAFYGFLCIINGLVNYTSPFTYADELIYENFYYRAKRVAEDMYSLFKNANNVDGVMLNEWMRKIKTVEETAERSRKFYQNDYFEGFFNVLNTFANPARWYNLIDNGNIHRDLERLDNNLDKLNNNRLFMLSTALRLG